MPELPEVETMCRGVRGIIGSLVCRVHQPSCAFRPISIRPKLSVLRQKLVGEQIVDVNRLGKRVLVHTQEHALILQPKMTGLVSLDHAPDQEHLRLRIDFQAPSSSCLYFWDRRGLGTIELISRDEIQTQIVDGRLGPDALDVSEEDFLQRLASTSRPIKVALMDQRLVAGIGNLYASEILHVARVHPRRNADKISKQRARRIYQAVRAILLTAIECEGSTLSDGTYRTALNAPGSYQSKHLVYDQAGKPCRTCGARPIVRIVQAQRSTFYCPSCQRS